MIIARILGTIAILVAVDAVGASEAASSTTSRSGCTSTPSHQFDFWIGEWNVADPVGTPAGHSHIESILAGCALAEHWEGAGGARGVSYNAYDNGTQLCRQFWVDAQGGVLLLEGGIVDGNMVLQSTPSGAHRDRISWTPNRDGSVRQRWEVSENGGKTWVASFNGVYRRAH